MRCDASKWRLGTTTVVPGLSLLPPGTTAVVPGLFPLALDAVIPARHSLGCPYVTRGRCVVDRTVGECPITCSPRHLTSYLSHPYISTHSLRAHWPLALFPSLCFSVSQATSLGSKTTRQSSISSYTSRAGPRLTALQHVHMRLLCCLWNCTILQCNLILAQYRSFRIRASRNSRNSE